MSKARDMLAKIARALGPLCDRGLFVGGTIRELLITDTAASPPRPTDDVDIVFPVASFAEHVALGEELRSRGLSQDTSEGAPICRWTFEGVRLDVMPTEPSILGFSNVWYPSALTCPMTHDLDGRTIRVLDGPHFCATKLEAFLSRGEGDFYHHDIEDFLAIVDGRASLLDDLERCPQPVRDFVVSRVSQLLATPDFVESLAGHLHGDEASQGRLPLLRAALERMAALSVEADDAAESGPLRFGSLWSSGPAAPGDAVLLRSSNLHSAHYDASTNVLTITFTSSAVYEYRDVSEPVYRGLLSAYSHGRYFNQWIKRRYQTVLVVRAPRRGRRLRR